MGCRNSNKKKATCFTFTYILWQKQTLPESELNKLRSKKTTTKTQSHAKDINQPKLLLEESKQIYSSKTTVSLHGKAKHEYNLNGHPYNLIADVTPVLIIAFEFEHKKLNKTHQLTNQLKLNQKQVIDNILIAIATTFDTIWCSTVALPANNLALIRSSSKL